MVIHGPPVIYHLVELVSLRDQSIPPSHGDGGRAHSTVKIVIPAKPWGCPGGGESHPTNLSLKTRSHDLCGGYNEVVTQDSLH